jgi:hypothetical protein
MADLNLYRQVIEDLLQDFHGYSYSRKQDNVESELILDRERDHYLWLEVGWQDNEYVYAPFIHIDIKDGKIWLQRNFTDVDLGKKLIEMGVKKEDIILGLHSPFMRKFSGYGVA